MRAEALLVQRRLQNSEVGTRPSGADNVDSHLSSGVCTPTPTMLDSVSVLPRECPGSSILTTVTAMSLGHGCKGGFPPAELSTPWLGALRTLDEFPTLLLCDPAGVSCLTAPCNEEVTTYVSSRS